MNMGAKDSIDTIDFVVGSGRKLEEIIRDDEVMPLLQDTLLAGASMAMVTDPQGKVLWASGPDSKGGHMERYPLSLEGEIAGYLAIEGEGQVDHISRMTYNALNLLVQTNLKSMLTSEVHLLVLNQSNEELLESNKQLSASEKKYRELSEHLEEKVKERTLELNQAHARLLQQEKMASIGQLAAGIAHEINNPMGFVMSNLHTLNTYMNRSKELLQQCLAAADKGMVLPEFATFFREKWKQLNMDTILSDAGDLIQESIEGSERVKHIVSNLRGISHIDENVVGKVDINEELDMIINLLSHEIPSGAKIIKEYNPIPRFICNPGFISQCFLNIIMNSLQSRSEGLEVFIQTACKDNQIIVVIKDNGPGIADGVISRIFEPFFTTKDVGQGTGLGLTMAYDIIVSHGGTIDVEGKTGATFKVKLPIRL
jgi:two-component system, NtrC family, sensor kinase